MQTAFFFQTTAAAGRRREETRLGASTRSFLTSVLTMCDGNETAAAAAATPLISGQFWR